LRVSAQRPVPFLGAVDVERVGKPQVAERDHRLGEAGGHLAHALDLALRRELLDLRVQRRGREHAQCESGQP
jgi:hypothetical protein